MNNALLRQQKLIIVHNTTTQMGLIQNEVFQLRGMKTRQKRGCLGSHEILKPDFHAVLQS